MFKVSRTFLPSCKHDFCYGEWFKKLLRGDSNCIRVFHRRSLIVFCREMSHVCFLRIFFYNDCTIRHIIFFMMSTGVDFRTATLRTSGRMPRMSSSMKPVLKISSIAKFSNTVRSTIVSKSPILTCNVMLPFDLSRSFDRDRNDGYTSLHKCANQLVGRKSLEIKFYSTSILRSKSQSA